MDIRTDNLNVKNEVIRAVREWTENPNMTIEQVETYCDDTCSLWNNLEELIQYFNEDYESITEEELRKAKWCVELSSGEFMMMG
jgi:hypothetical protein